VGLCGLLYGVAVVGPEFMAPLQVRVGLARGVLKKVQLDQARQQAVLVPVVLTGAVGPGKADLVSAKVG
jgi:hypothetical protein